VNNLLKHNNQNSLSFLYFRGKLCSVQGRYSLYAKGDDSLGDGISASPYHDDSGGNGVYESHNEHVLTELPKVEIDNLVFVFVYYLMFLLILKYLFSFLARV
jgi:hypothetical protein